MTGEQEKHGFLPLNIRSLPQQGSGEVQDELTLIILIHRQKSSEICRQKTKNNLMPLTYCSGNTNRDECGGLSHHWFQTVLKNQGQVTTEHRQSILIGKASWSKKRNHGNAAHLGKERT